MKNKAGFVPLPRAGAGCDPAWGLGVLQGGWGRGQHPQSGHPPWDLGASRSSCVPEHPRALSCREQMCVSVGCWAQEAPRAGCFHTWVTRHRGRARLRLCPALSQCCWGGDWDAPGRCELLLTACVSSLPSASVVPVVLQGHEPTRGAGSLRGGGFSAILSLGAAGTTFPSVWGGRFGSSIWDRTCSLLVRRRDSGVAWGPSFVGGLLPARCPYTAPSVPCPSDSCPFPLQVSWYRVKCPHCEIHSLPPT